MKKYILLTLTALLTLSMQAAKKEKKQEVAKETVNNIAVEKLYDYEYLISNFYTIDGSTSVTEKLLDAKKLLKKDMAINKKIKKFKNDNIGMSLIEILVTIAMILILAGPLINSLLNSRILNSKGLVVKIENNIVRAIERKV